MRLWVSDDRTMLVRLYEGPPGPGRLDGETVLEVAVRDDADGVWGPPVRLAEERTR